MDVYHSTTSSTIASFASIVAMSGASSPSKRQSPQHGVNSDTTSACLVLAAVAGMGEAAVATSAKVGAAASPAVVAVASASCRRRRSLTEVAICIGLWARGGGKCSSIGALAEEVGGSCRSLALRTAYHFIRCI